MDDLIPLKMKKKITAKVYEDKNSKRKRTANEKSLRNLVKRSFTLGSTYHKLNPIGVSAFLVINLIRHAFTMSYVLCVCM